MAGHSKWKNIQHRKGAQDKKRGKLFTKALKEVSVAVKVSGPDPDSNPRLRAAVQTARGYNVPKDTIERAIKKASGEGVESLIETTFECYGPEGVAVFVECATDNNTRTVANVRSYFNKHGGSIGKDGCLQFIFEQKGVFSLAKNSVQSEEDLTLTLIDAGAEDVDSDEENINVFCSKEDFGALQKALQDLGVETSSAGLERIPITTKEINLETYGKMIKLLDILEDDEDVQKVYHNIEYREEFDSL